MTSTPRSPIRVALHVTESGKRGVRWTCEAHPRARGFHPFRTFTDHVRPNWRPPAWDRAHDAARLHHHIAHRKDAHA